MILIAHRGNTSGKNRPRENSPDQIDRAIHLGFHVEIDVWAKEGEPGQLWLGHDEPTYSIDFEFIDRRMNYLWIHCKNVMAMVQIEKYLHAARYFFHQGDDYALTSHRDIWCYPTRLPWGTKSIVVLPEGWMEKEKVLSYCEQYKVAGICSDFVASFRKT
jgi:hypothetical protein